MSRTVYRLVWIPSLIAIVGMAVAFSQQPLSVPKPGAMQPYKTEDGALSLQCPSNWKPKVTSAQAVMTEVKFEPATNIRLVITADMVGSLMSDITKSPLPDDLNSMPGMERLTQEVKKTPLEKAHEGQKAAFKKRYKKKEYQEGETEKTQLAGTEAMATSFTFQEAGGFKTAPMEGKFYTALGGERQLTVSYQYPKESAKEIAPLFEEMVASVRTGEGGQ